MARLFGYQLDGKGGYIHLGTGRRWDKAKGEAPWLAHIRAAPPKKRPPCPVQHPLQAAFGQASITVLIRLADGSL